MKRIISSFIIVTMCVFLICSLKVKGSEKEKQNSARAELVAEEAYIDLLRDRLEEEGYAHAGLTVSCQKTAISREYTISIYHKRLCQADMQEISAIFDGLKQIVCPIDYAEVEFCLQK